MVGTNEGSISVVDDSTERMIRVGRSVCLVTELVTGVVGQELTDTAINTSALTAEQREHYALLVEALATSIVSQVTLMKKVAEISGVSLEDGYPITFGNLSPAEPLALETPQPVETTELGDNGESGEPQGAEELEADIPLVINIDGNEFSAEQLELSKGEIELFKVLMEFGSGPFKRGDIIRLGYLSDASEGARNQSFPNNITSLAQKFELAAGRPVITHTGEKSTSQYEMVLLSPASEQEQEGEILEPDGLEGLDNGADTQFAEPESAEEEVEVVQEGTEDDNNDPPGNTVEKPAHLEAPPPVDRISLAERETVLEQGGEDDAVEAEGVLIDAFERSDRAAAQRPTTRVQARTPTTSRRIARAATAPRSLLEDYIPANELPPLNEVLANLVYRDPTEVLENDAIKLSVVSALDAGKILDYKPRVIMPLRYGIYPPKFAKTPVFINRGGQRLPLADIMEHVPEYVPECVGLDLESTSLILGITPQAILQVERAFLKKHCLDTKATRKLRDVVEAQLESLK